MPTASAGATVDGSGGREPIGEGDGLADGLASADGLALGDGAGLSETLRTTRAVWVAPAWLKVVSTLTVCPAIAWVIVSWQVAQPSPPLVALHGASPPG